jgi:hypothetical protein
MPVALGLLLIVERSFYEKYLEKFELNELGNP